MRLRGAFWILSALLLITLGILTYFVFYNSSTKLFFIVEGLLLLTVIYLIIFYQRIVKPLHIIGNGMELLREQDFSSRLAYVGQAEADRIVDIFNKMMEQLKDERLHLREQNHFLDLLIDASPMGVVILDLDRKIQSVNLAMCRFLYIDSYEQLLGKKLDEIDASLTSELNKIPLYESQTIRLNDANIYKCTHSSFVDQGFHHSFFLVESLTQEVFKAEKKAYEKVIRMIAHEVNNTTAGITSTLDTLTTTFREMNEMEDVCDVLRVSIERCYRMSDFITNFADVVRIPEPQLQQQSLNEMVVDSKRFMETICHSRNIRIKLELTAASPTVNLDHALFEQVLVNIIKNSAEAIGQDGTISIRTTDSPVVMLEITDTGTGIDSETEMRLFSPFFSTKANGQGIGLIFIREVLQKHNCQFSLKTYPDGLTRFRIIFKT
ncbi:PAS domain-containing protein [Parabacteroides sp. OttesenSCG-928-G21]|nr:PAS domain-containing protein [Parabacteroides sp. OttesenSCG-928-G21]